MYCFLTTLSFLKYSNGSVFHQWLCNTSNPYLDCALTCSNITLKWSLNSIFDLLWVNLSPIFPKAFSNQNVHAEYKIFSKILSFYLSRQLAVIQQNIMNFINRLHFITLFRCRLHNMFSFSSVSVMVFHANCSASSTREHNFFQLQQTYSLSNNNINFLFFEINKKYS